MIRQIPAMQYLQQAACPLVSAAAYHMTQPALLDDQPALLLPQSAWAC